MKRSLWLPLMAATEAVVIESGSAKEVSVRRSRRRWRSFHVAFFALLALVVRGPRLHAQTVSSVELRAAVEGTWHLEEWHVNGQVLRPPQVDGRWSNHDGVVLFMVHQMTGDSVYSQTGYGTYQMDASMWSYVYSRMEAMSGRIGGPAQVTTSRIDSRSFRVSRQGSKIVLTFTGPDDDRREYDGAFYTLIQNGKVVRRWRRVE